MRIAFVGAGGVGGTFGARLCASGEDVTFVARGAHGEALRRQGLRLRSERGDLHVPSVRVVAAPAEVGAVDLVVVAVKLWDAEPVAAALAAADLGPSAAVVSLQNGIDKDDVLVQRLGAARVLGGTAQVLATIAEPGVIVQSGTLQRVILGELAGGTSPRVAAAVAAFLRAGIDAVESADVRRATWEKLAFLASNAAVTAVTRQTIGAVRALAPTRRLLRDAIAEVAAVARAEGVALAEDFVDDRLRFIDTLPGAGRASMANDLLAGRRLELEWLSGAVVRRGERAGVETPVHRTLLAALFPFAGGPPAS